ncbi:S-adenosyl-L-methionine-dependent methyltransferase [Schizophyllum amplum]|uniref:Histone-lysine N-methyltransferase, H3 lysine-79 specific n=1 Tax=Schizophyllum amplum TaxID=97359 RepID=A0A550C7X0_9AGAR|nr:S-adenosyl-L-methionine-dependent methyltransferase [Auriculariopsis ampla]
MRVLRELRRKHVDHVVDLLPGCPKIREVTYGEFQPYFVHTILEEVHLDSASTVVDLGSGIGNLVIQAAIQIGCDAYGVELRPELHIIAEELHLAARLQCAHLAVPMGRVVLENADMLLSPRVAEWVARADLLVANNKVLGVHVINRHIIDRLICNMKHGAVVIATDPFIATSQTRSGNRYTTPVEGTQLYWCADDARLEVVKRSYPKDSVSWASAPGDYYVHRMYKVNEVQSKQEVMQRAYEVS